MEHETFEVPIDVSLAYLESVQAFLAPDAIGVYFLPWNPRLALIEWPSNDPSDVTPVDRWRIESLPKLSGRAN